MHIIVRLACDLNTERTSAKRRFEVCLVVECVRVIEDVRNQKCDFVLLNLNIQLQMRDALFTVEDVAKNS